MKFLKIVLKIVSAALGILGLVFLAMILNQGDDSIEMGDDGIVSSIIYLAFVVLGIAVLSTILFSLLNLFSSKEKFKKSIISILSFGSVIALAFFLSEGVETPMQDGEVLSENASRWVETGIRTFYILVIVAAVIMVFNYLKKIIKK
jgi:membrane protease YdiL (CAAX protease family)